MDVTANNARLTRLSAALLAGFALVVGLLVAPATPAQAHVGDPAYGRLIHGDGHLKPGCRRYYFHYRLKQAGDEWTFEIFWVDRRGTRVADQILLSESDPKRGRNHVRFCRANTVPGRVRLEGRLIVYSGYDSHTHWVKPARFHMSG